MLIDLGHISAYKFFQNIIGIDQFHAFQGLFEC